MSARLFLAVEVAEEDRAALTAWAREAVGADAGMRVVDAGQVHLTLAFLGHRPLEEIEPLSALATELGEEAGVSTARRRGRRPRSRRCRPACPPCRRRGRRCP